MKRTVQVNVKMTQEDFELLKKALKNVGFPGMDNFPRSYFIKPKRLRSSAVHSGSAKIYLITLEPQVSPRMIMDDGAFIAGTAFVRLLSQLYVCNRRVSTGRV